MDEFITTKATSNAAVMTKAAGKAFAHFLKNFLSLILSQIQTPHFYQLTIRRKTDLLKSFYCLNKSIY